jgi:hypothetical protein
VTDADFDRATEAAQNAAQYTHAMGCSESHAESDAHEKTPVLQG